VEGKPGRVDHSTAGALHAIELHGILGRIPAYCIAGHHAGLPDWQDAFAPRASLANRMEQSEHLMAARDGAIPPSISEHPLPADKAKSGTRLSRSLWLRMLFSCLVDADFLTPVLAVIRELQINYGVTFVLSTATQPALGPHKSMDFDFPGLPGLREIIPASLNLHERLQRTSVELVGKLDRPLGWDELAGRLAGHDSVICIVNRRDDARTLWKKMPTGAFHLSALMCGAHRSVRIEEIKASLKEGKSTRVVSTQLVEAGVDFDFPVVYRALAGLDSVAQAAGRCNREGRLAAGRVYVFQPESKIPVGHLRQAAEIGRQILVADENGLLAPERFEEFFKTLYWIKGDGLDRKGIMALLANDRELRISFRTAAKKFRLIDDTASASVVVHCGEGTKLIELLRRQEPERWLLRRLQRFVVNLPHTIHAGLVAEGAIEEIRPGIFVQAQGNLYDEQLGLCVDRSMIYAPDELMI